MKENVKCSTANTCANRNGIQETTQIKAEVDKVVYGETNTDKDNFNHDKESVNLAGTGEEKETELDGLPVDRGWAWGLLAGEQEDLTLFITICILNLISNRVGISTHYNNKYRQNYMKISLIYIIIFQQALKTKSASSSEFCLTFFFFHKLRL